jgi:CHASE3 domain sensor protein
MLIRKHPALKKRIEDAAREHLKDMGNEEGDLAQSEMASAQTNHFDYRDDD